MRRKPERVYLSGGPHGGEIVYVPRGQTVLKMPYLETKDVVLTNDNASPLMPPVRYHIYEYVGIDRQTGIRFFKYREG